MKKIIIVIILLHNLITSAQLQYFNKTFDLDYYDFLTNIEKSDSGYLIVEHLGWKTSIINLNLFGILTSFKDLNYGNIYLYNGFGEVFIPNNKDFILIGTGKINENNYGIIMKLDQNLDTVWVKKYADTTLPEINTNFDEVIATFDGGYAVCGLRKMPGNYNNDALLVKFDSNGNLLWEKTYGGLKEEDVLSIAQTYDNGFILGGMYNDPNQYNKKNGLIIKTDSNGNQQWSKQLGNTLTDDHWCRVSSLKDSTILVVYGHGISQPYPGEYYYSKIRVIKYDYHGNIKWSKYYDTAYIYSRIRKIAQLVNSDILLLIEFEKNYQRTYNTARLLKITNNGDSLWMRDYVYHAGNTLPLGQDTSAFNHIYDLVPADDGGFAMAGWCYKSPPLASHQDIWILKTDSMGCLSPGCDSLTVPIILQQPRDTTAYTYRHATFSTKATGTPVLHYQWQWYNSSNWHNLQDTGHYTGTATPRMRITYIPQYLHHQYYRCKISNKQGDVYTDSAMLQVDSTENIAELMQQKYSISIIPNPACNIVQIHTAVTHFQDMMLEICDILGNISYKEKLSKAATAIQTQHWPEGLYVVQLKCGNLVVGSAKLIIQKP